MKRKAMMLAVVLSALAAAGVGLKVLRDLRAGTARTATTGYHCPMHPSFHSDKPGSCPICNMTLVPDGEGDSDKPKGNAKRICLLHKCKMTNCLMELTMEVGQKVHCPLCGEAEAAEVADKGKPLYYRDPMNPAITSPVPKKDEMGMDYIAVYPEEGAPSQVPGQGTVTLSEERRQQIGMESSAVKYRDLAVVIRATGQVAYDPDLYHAITEYSEAVKARDAVKNSPYPDVHQRADALVQASDLRLRQMGLSQTQIGQIAESTAPPTNLLFGGPGGTVWVYAQVYEYEIPLVKPGQSVDIATLAYPGRKFHGVVKSVDPIVSAETRSLRARIEVPNPDGLLTLQMYVDAAIRADIGRKLALPSSALIDTGTRKIVFIDLGNGRLEPREVQVGRQAEGFYEVLSGLKEGEKIVTSANFLIDSESKLKAITPPSRQKQSEHQHQH